MKHAIRYLGHHDSSFSDLRPESSRYRRKDGTCGSVIPRPASVDGILFGYMECQGKVFEAVRAEYGDQDVCLKKPVRLTRLRHTDGKGFGPNPSQFGDRSAKRLLDDMISSNPEQAGLLGAIAAKLGWSTSRPAGQAVDHDR